MTPSGAASGPGVFDGNEFIFNAPPGWPVPPAGWRPPPGWQPDPAWPAPPPGWTFWLPAGAGPAPGSAAGPDSGAGQDSAPGQDSGAGQGGGVRLSLAGRELTVRPGQVARIGRSPDNDLVAEDATVSRQHAMLRAGPGGWELENTGSAATYLNGQPVTRVTVDRALELALGSANGPVLRIEPQAAALSAPQGAPVQGAALPAAPVQGAAVQGAAVPAGPGADAAPGWGSAPGQGRPYTPYWQPQPPPDAAVPPPQAAPLSGDDVATALRILFPVQSWLHNSGWRQGLRLLVIAYAVLPLLFLAVLSSSTALSTPGWAYSLYIAPLWLVGFWMLIRPGIVGKREFIIGAAIAAFTLVWINAVTINVNDALHVAGPIPLPDALVIGVNEEVTKALPVLLAGLVLLRRWKTKLDVRMWMLLGTVAGLTFGVAEQAFYTSNDIVAINQAQSANVAVNGALAFAERIFIDGFQHAVWAGIAGFFIGMALNYRRRRVQLILLGVAVPALLHALNDYLAGTSVWLVILVQVASLLLFLGYTMSAESIEQKVRQTPLFRGQSMVLEAFRDPPEPPPAQ